MSKIFKLLVVCMTILTVTNHCDRISDTANADLRVIAFFRNSTDARDNRASFQIHLKGTHPSSITEGQVIMNAGASMLDFSRDDYTRLRDNGDEPRFVFQSKKTVAAEGNYYATVRFRSNEGHAFALPKTIDLRSKRVVFAPLSAADANLALLNPDRFAHVD